MFPISIIKGEPKWNSLPVAKIINYPLEKGDYKPYAQARLCISEECIYIQLLAFEVESEEASTVAVALAPFPENDGQKRYFLLSTNRSGIHSCKFIDEQAETEKDLTKHISIRIYMGEDEQGVYWCSGFTVPRSLLEELFEKAELVPGHIMKGNFYKFCNGKRPHRGSFFPCNFSGENPFKSDCFGAFELVLY